jgi:hypothetical protein
MPEFSTRQGATVTADTYLKSADLDEEHDKVLERIIALYGELFRHDGHGTMRLEMRFLKKGQKEVLIHCGKEYRFVVNYPGGSH